MTIIRRNGRMFLKRFKDMYDWACQKNDKVNIEHSAGRMEACAGVENKIK